MDADEDAKRGDSPLSAAATRSRPWLRLLLAGSMLVISKPAGVAHADETPSSSSSKSASAPQPAQNSPKPAEPAARSGAAKPTPAAKPAVASASASAPPPSAADSKPRTEEELARAAVANSTPDTSTDNAMDNVLDDALAHPKDRNAELRAAQQAAALSQQALPLAPSRDDVMKAMSMLVPAIRGCAQGKSGLATVTMVVKNDGHVESAALSGAPFAGTASGGCMEGVVRRAKFPRFKQASFRVQFPFAVQ